MKSAKLTTFAQDEGRREEATEEQGRSVERRPSPARVPPAVRQSPSEAARNLPSRPHPELGEPGASAEPETEAEGRRLGTERRLP
jgi:hypothetical protein